LNGGNRLYDRIHGSPCESFYFPTSSMGDRIGVSTLRMKSFVFFCIKECGRVASFPIPIPAKMDERVNLGPCHVRIGIEVVNPIK